jgi:hypothetical protein
VKGGTFFLGSGGYEMERTVTGRIILEEMYEQRFFDKEWDKLPWNVDDSRYYIPKSANGRFRIHAQS